MYCSHARRSSPWIIIESRLAGDANDAADTVFELEELTAEPKLRPVGEALPLRFEVGALIGVGVPAGGAARRGRCRHYF